MATDRIAWELTADPVPIERAFERAGVAADKAYERANKAITKETGLINTLTIRLDRLKVARDKAHDPKQIERINALISEQSNRLNQLTGNVTRLGNEMGKTTQKAGFLGGQIDQLAGMIAGAFTIQGIIAFTKNVTQASVALEGMERQLKAITGTEAEAAQEMDYLRAISEQYGLNLEKTAQAYISFAGASTRSGMSMAQTRDIFESVSMATTVMGLTADQTQGAFLALQQMISKGTVQAEELRGQLSERIPGAFSLATEAARRMTGNLDLTEKQFGKMLEQGQVLSRDLLPELAKVFKETFEKDVAEAADGGAAALNRMSTAFFNLLTSVGNTAPITGAVNAITALTDAVTRGVKVLSQGAVQTYLDERKLEQTLMAQTVIKKLNNQLDTQKLTIDERKTRFDKLLQDGRRKEQELLLEEAQIKAKLYTGTQQENKAKKERLFALMVEIQNQQVYNGLILTESDLLIKQVETKKELTKEEEARLEKERKAQAKANEEKKKAIELERKRIQESIKFLIDFEATQAEEVGLSQKKWNDLIRINIDGLDEIKTPYESALYQLDRLRSRDEINEEQYLERKLELQRKFGENSVKTFDELFKFRKDKEDKARKESVEQERQRNQLIAESALELTGILSNVYQSQTIDLQRQLDQGLITQESYEARLRQIKRKEFEVDRIAALAKIAINTAVQASAATPVLAPFIIAAGAAQALVVATKPNPYAKGTKRVKGGQEGRDSVPFIDGDGSPALLMPGEMIMPKDRTKQHAPYLDNVFDGRISPTQSRWAAGLFVNQTIEPGLLRYMASISGGGASDSRQISQLVKAITKKKSPDFNKPADRIVKAIYQTSTSNSFSSWRKYKK